MKDLVCSIKTNILITWNTCQSVRTLLENPKTYSTGISWQKKTTFILTHNHSQNCTATHIRDIMNLMMTLTQHRRLLLKTWTGMN